MLPLYPDHVQFDELSPDILHNRIFLASVGVVGARQAGSGSAERHSATTPRKGSGQDCPARKRSMPERPSTEATSRPK